MHAEDAPDDASDFQEGQGKQRVRPEWRHPVALSTVVALVSGRQPPVKCRTSEVRTGNTPTHIKHFRLKDRNSERGRRPRAVRGWTNR
eukprot:8829538-Alexandrium_andersonii.AAC.1